MHDWNWHCITYLLTYFLETVCHLARIVHAVAHFTPVRISLKPKLAEHKAHRTSVANRRHQFVTVWSTNQRRAFLLRWVDALADGTSDVILDESVLAGHGTHRSFAANQRFLCVFRILLVWCFFRRVFEDLLLGWLGRIGRFCTLTSTAAFQTVHISPGVWEQLLLVGQAPSFLFLSPFPSLISPFPPFPLHPLKAGPICFLPFLLFPSLS